MITVREALAWGTRYLRERGVISPSLDARVLLAHCTGLDLPGLYRQLERVLSEDERKAFRQLIYRRSRREPVAYLTGHKEFMGLDFYVSPFVLIPRPETELLVEKSLELLDKNAQVFIVDAGTGSGAIAVSLATYLPLARVYATDISPLAIEVARKNAARHGVEDRVTFLVGDLLSVLEGLQLEKRVNLIAANLPYIPTSSLQTLMPDVGLYEPRQALDGGTDGLDLYRRLIPQARKFLAPDGHLLMEIGAEQGEKIGSLLAFNGFQHEIAHDLAGQPRLVVARPGEKLIDKLFF